jgi:hypothetical protein
LYEELCRDLQPHMAELMTRRWLAKQTGPCHVVCETVRDYCNDYRALKPTLAHALLMNIQMRFLAEYLIAMEKGLVHARA